ncbi:inositol 1,4,5-trisphosphate-gated calcium channel ITPR1-like [Dysidea avara]|uniref:inositol 1,4,5-trisphosphate-gated calcium channel ITPR1-like n=1 Tax=Dysidea avara TaxID=196820 RepID=UPI00331D7235
MGFSPQDFVTPLSIKEWQNRNYCQIDEKDYHYILESRSSSADHSMMLQIAEKNAKIELKNNESEQERQKGTPVLYGSTIQLLHTFTNKYVAISTTQASKTEYTNMQVHLLSHDSDNCLFRILPRYKVRSVGDEVRMEDQITFSSEKTEGQYIHTSARLFRQVGITLHENCHEINASANESGYTLRSHYHASLNEEDFIRGSSIIRLFHRELECYLAAEGSFANEKDEVVTEEVHLRKRKSEHGNLKAPSTSAITYWQIVKDKEPLNGQVLSWGERCRIKHLPTRRYLAIVKEDNGYKVTLKGRKRDSPKADLDTVFRLFPVIDEDRGIQFESYARINHPHTKTWLVARKGERYTRQTFDPNASGLASLQWDSAELIQIGIQEQMNYDDAFTIEEVDSKLVKKFTFVAGIVPVMQAYIMEVLNELSDFMKFAHPRMKDHQKLLRNLMVLELLVQILKTYDQHDAHLHHPVYQACYKVLEVYLLGQSRKNENYLARFIDFFEQQMGMGLNTEQMLTELVRDNSLIISKFGKDKVDSIIHWLIDSKNSYFFDYLGVLCVCNDRPIPENQDNIIEKLVKQHGQELFYLTEVHRVEEVVQGSEEGGHSTKKEIHYCTPNEHRWIPLSKIAAAKGNLTDTKEYQFLVAQLDLFGKLCKGNNTSAVHTIDVEFNYLTFEEALTGAQDDNLHHALRSKYVELIVVLYVDVGSNRAILDNLSLSFVYKNIVSDPYKSAAEDPTIALTGVQNIYFPQLKDWIQHYVEQNMSVIASLVNVNNLNAEVLNLLFLLVKYGYYADINDINALITPLLSLLNGKNDKEFPYATPDENDHFTLEGRFEDNHKNRAIFRMKIMALKVMDLFFNFRFYLRLQHFIYDYKLLKGSAPNTDQQTPRPQIRPRHVSSTQQLTTRLSHQVSDTTVRVTQQITQQMTAEFNSLATRLGLVIDDYPEPPSELKRLQTHSHELKIHDKEWLMSLAVSRLKRIFSISFYNCDSAIENGLTFPQILIDLSQYNNDELLHESLYLLGRFYSAEENLFEKAIQTQLLITPESESVYNKISTLLPTLRHLAAIDVNKTRCQELVNILDDLIGLCHLEGDKNQSHEQNQKILYNTGVFADVLNIIFQEKSTRLISSDGLVESTPHIDLESTEMQQREKVLSKCLQFLKLLSRNNSVIQEHLFDHMDDLLQLDVAIPDMAGLLTEVFTGGKEICLKLKEQQVQQVFNLIVHGGTVGRAELLTMLQATVKVEELDLPLKRNQGYIIKYFSKMRENFCNDVLGLEDRKVARRKQLLLKTEDNDPVLQMLLKLIDLLASCSEGENLFIESICQNLMSINELLKILCMHNLSPSRKKPFVRFLLWVYMNTGGDKIQTGSVLLYHDPEIWSFMDHTSLMLHEFVGALKKFPELSPQPIHQSVKESVHISCKLVPDFLLYLMEGVLPMLKVFYGEYFLPYDTSDISSESNHRTSPESEVKISAAIGSSLLLMAEFIKNFIKSQDQWDLLHTTILTVLKHDCFDDEALDIDPVVRARFDQSVTYDVTTKHPLMKEYDEIYQQEILLNEEFNNFVRNYELAYWGPNTAKCQIGSPHEIPYSEFDDELLEEKGDEWLPLGPSFQKHVSCYVIHNMSESTVRHYTKRIIDCLVSSYDNLAYHNEKERQKQDRNNIKYLHLLRAIIHNEIMFINHEEEIDPVLYRKLSERIKSVQNQIQLLGNTVERIVRLLSHPNDSISAEVLAFLSTLLYAGNKTVQEGFSYLMHTREEKLFSNIQKRLQQAAINDRERRALLAQLESRLETQKVLRDTVVARSVHADTVSQLAANKEMFSCGPDITTLFLSSGAVQSKTNSTMSLEDISDVSPRKRLVSVINYRDLHHKNKQRKRRISQLNLTELLAEAGLAEDEIQLQKLQAAYEDKTSSKDGKKTDSLKFKDTSYIDLALRVLGLMCDCQYRPMQNYLREQPDNIKTINLVSEICMFLSSFYVDVTKDNIELVTRVLQTMIEMSVVSSK